MFEHILDGSVLKGVFCLLTVVGFMTLVSILPESASAGEGAAKSLRPPAVPLVTHDPYFSTWCMADRLTGDWPKHWTGAVTGMAGLARVDGKPYRFMGIAPGHLPVMDQVSLQVTPTRSIYEFEAAGIRMTLTFMSPVLVKDLDVFVRPVTYLTWDVKSSDGQLHSVQLYLDVTGEWTVFAPDQKVVASRSGVSEMSVLRIGTEEQPVVKRPGDSIKIDWGYLYLTMPGASGSAIGADGASRDRFVTTGLVLESDDTNFPRPACEDWPVLAFAVDLGTVGTETVSKHAMLAYDEIYSVEYLGDKLRPYWRRDGMEIDELLTVAEKEYDAVYEKCVAFDKKLMKSLTEVGGKKYAELCALAYRQCIAACGYSAGPNGDLLIFSKENSSNGCIGTVDVMYPASPFFLLFSPEMMKGHLTPVLDYAASDRWSFPFAPHDVGTYPLANGQVYGGGEKTEENQMPVEESGNMLLMLAALAQAEGNADYADRYWPLLTQWAEYLREKGMDPENQLCTDDFMGHLAHNANLSLKAILALDAYGRLADLTGREGTGDEYHALAKKMAQDWIKMADDGDHYRLAFDKPDTWSMKYNLVWDGILGLDVFPPEVAKKEIAYYRTRMNPMNLPLDSRSDLTKTDWLFWTATLAKSDKDFQEYVDRAYRYFNETSRRVAMTDAYWNDPDRSWLHARPVIGGLYIKMVSDDKVWRMWSE